MDWLHGSPRFYYAGAAMLLAMLIGGGTGQQLWSDHVVMLALAPAWYFALSDARPLRFPVSVLALAAAVIALLICQFLPVWREPAAGFADAGSEGAAFLTMAPARTWFAMLYAVSLLGYFLMLSRFRDREHDRLLRFFVVGLFANLVVAALQLSFDGSASISNLLPHEIRMGMFANENHFSTLVFVSIPLLAWRWLGRGNRPYAYGGFCIATMAILLAAGSRAGVLIAIALAGASTVLVAGRTAPVPLLRHVAVAAAAAGGIAFGAKVLPGIAVDQRIEFAANTLAAIGDHWLIGTGLGSFPQIYPAYEAIEAIGRTFANHAHNDWLELWLETGLAGPVLAILFIVAVVRGAARGGFATAAALAIGAVCLHSLVDYPLRTLAIAVPFAFLAAVACCVPGEPERGRVREAEPDFDNAGIVIPDPATQPGT